MNARNAQPQQQPLTRREYRARRRTWRPGILTVLIAVLALTGTAVGIYPMTAQWLTSYNQAQVVDSYHSVVAAADPEPAEQLNLAHDYNDALSVGKVVVGADTNKPQYDGSANTAFDYESMLSTGFNGIMARIRIPKIDVDLPVLHGTDDKTLLAGAGHLEGTHLPVGGESTRTVITAHRGLADARMFTDLDQLAVGDTFSIDVFGETLTYQIITIEVIDPSDTGTIRPVVGEDLATLITCTPLGINSHRIVVTGERITPTPIKEVEAAAAPTELPGTPWWIVIAITAAVLISAYVIRRGFVDARLRARARDNKRKAATQLAATQASVPVAASP